MDLGNWDDDDDFGALDDIPKPGAAGAADIDDDFDDLIQFTDALTLQAEQENGYDDDTGSTDEKTGTGTDSNSQSLPPLPKDTIDLTRKRGVLLRLHHDTDDDDDAASSANEVSKNTKFNGINASTSSSSSNNATASSSTSTTPAGDTSDDQASAKSKLKPSADHPFIELHFDGYLNSTGERFDSSRDLNYPMIIRLDLPPSGQSTVIPGLELGLRELSAGDRATLTIKAPFAYGAEGSDDIPPNSDLRFELDVLDVRATRKRAKHAPVDNTKSDLSRLEDVRRQREIAQQRREEEKLAKDEEKKRKADRAAQLREKIANKTKGGGAKPKKGGKKKK